MSKRLVLLGAGHAHVEVLRAFAERPPPGAALTVISPYAEVPYTGMLPGVVAGRYSLAEASINAAVLAARAGAAFIGTRGLHIDRARRIVRCGNGAEVAYDVLSVNVGAVARNPLQSSAGARLLPTKPAEPFMAALDVLVSASIAVVGGGYGGVELAAALRRRGARVTLVTGRAGLAPSAPPAARAMIARRLAARGVTLADGAAVSADEAELMLGDGRRIDADAIVLAAGVVPPGVVADLDLPKDALGFLSAGADLASAGDPSIFAAGDCASPGGLPKAGVYAVREGPVLAANLRAALAGAPRRRFRPQANYLSILSFWPDGAVAIRGGLAAEGRWAGGWKDRIDRRFIARYR